jgi:hypothetical protein
LFELLPLFALLLLLLLLLPLPLLLFVPWLLLPALLLLLLALLLLLLVLPLLNGVHGILLLFVLHSSKDKTNYLTTHLIMCFFICKAFAIM